MRVEEAMHKPIRQVAEAIRTGALSPVELTTAYLDRIAQKDGQLHAFVHIASDALDQAKSLEVAAKEGRIVGPLHGIPLAIKDNYLTADMPTRAGTEATIEFANAEGQRSASCAKPAPSCSARPGCTSSPGAWRRRRPATRSTPTGYRAAPAAGRA